MPSLPKVEKLFALGQRDSRRITARVQRNAARALKGQESVNSRQLILDLEESLTAAMVAGFMLGRAEARKNVGTQLATVYEQVLQQLERETGLSREEIEELYADQARALLDELGATVQSNVQDSINELIGSGIPTNNALRVLREQFGDSLAQVETQYRTQLQWTINAGQYIEYQDPDLQEIIWGYEYLTVNDNRVRPEHEELHGTVLPKNHPFWDNFWPPNGWNCRCFVVPVFEPQQPKPPDEIPEVDQEFVGNPGQQLVGVMTQ